MAMPKFYLTPGSKVFVLENDLTCCCYNYSTSNSLINADAALVAGSFFIYLKQPLAPGKVLMLEAYLEDIKALIPDINEYIHLVWIDNPSWENTDNWNYQSAILAGKTTNQFYPAPLSTRTIKPGNKQIDTLDFGPCSLKLTSVGAIYCSVGNFTYFQLIFDDFSGRESYFDAGNGSRWYLHQQQTASTPGGYLYPWFSANDGRGRQVPSGIFNELSFGKTSAENTLPIKNSIKYKNHEGDVISADFAETSSVEDAFLDYHPSRPYDPEKTFISFGENNFSLKISNLNGLTSHCRSTSLYLNSKNKSDFFKLFLAPSPEHTQENPSYYWCPQGKLALNENSLVLDGKGNEYITFNPTQAVNSGYYLNFISGQPADFSGAELSGQHTTSWLQIEKSDAEIEDPIYFKRDVENAVYSDEKEENGFLPYLDDGLVSVSAQPGTCCFPFIPSGGTKEQHEICALFNQGSLQPIRSHKIITTGAPVPVKPKLYVKTNYAYQYDSVNSIITSLYFAPPEAGKAYGQEELLGFCNISGPLNNMLRSGREFFVLSDVEALMGDASAPYALQLENLEKMKDETLLKPELIDQVIAYAKDGKNKSRFADEAEFESTLREISPQITLPDIRTFERYSGVNIITAGMLKFNFSPRNWQTGVLGQTMLLFKNTPGRSLAEICEDVPAWENNIYALDNENTRQTIKQIIYAARQDVQWREQEGKLSVYADFMAMADSKDFVGIIIFNCPLHGSDDFFDVDSSGLHAHHVVLRNTFNTGEQLSMLTRLQLLVDADLQKEPDHTANAGGFATSRFTCHINNSLLSGTWQVGLRLPELFGAPATLEPTVTGNALQLAGSFNGDFNSIAFMPVIKSAFRLSGSVLRSVEIEKVDASITKEAGAISMLLNCRGKLRFYETGSAFDPFAYGPYYVDDVERDGYLAFAGLQYRITFNEDEPVPVVESVSAKLALDVNSSLARPLSVAEKFPAKLVDFIYMEQNTLPGELGYTSVSSPLRQALLKAPWNAMLWELDLGSLGGLSQIAGLKLKILSAWNNAGIYLGIQLQFKNGATTALEWTIQRVFKLNFKTIEFCVNEGNGDYMLRLRNFALRILGIGLPPGYNDIYLFANPDQKANAKLGWYAAYTNGK